MKFLRNIQFAMRIMFSENMRSSNSKVQGDVFVSKTI